MPHSAPEAPSAWIRRFAPLVPPGARVLDVACGSGRHTRLFADRGCRVTAVDRAPSLAAAEGLRIVTADLESAPWPFADERYDTVVVTNYLHRPLFPHLLAALAPGGVLLYETFARGNAAFGKPSNPSFLLAPGELLAAFGGALRVLAFEDGYVATPRPAMVQRLAARAAADGELPPEAVALTPVGA